MLPLIHSPATAPKNTLEFSSAKDIIERERSKKQANGGSSETPENVHKTKSRNEAHNTELPAMIGVSPVHPNAVSTTTRTPGGVGMTITTFSPQGRPPSRGDVINNIVNFYESSPRSGGGFSKPSATEISLANATLIYAEAWRPGMQNVRRRRRSSARANNPNLHNTTINNNTNNNTTTITTSANSQSVSPPLLSTQTDNNTVASPAHNKTVLPTLTHARTVDSRQGKRAHSPDHSSSNNNVTIVSTSSAIPRLVASTHKSSTLAVSNNNNTTQTPSTMNTSLRPSSQQNNMNSNNQTFSPGNQRRNTYKEGMMDLPSKGTGLYAYLLPPANMPELQHHHNNNNNNNNMSNPNNTSRNNNNSNNKNMQFPNDDTAMDIDENEVLHFMWEGSPYLQSVGNHRLQRSRTPSNGKKRRGSRRPKQENGSNSDRSPSPSHGGSKNTKQVSPTSAVAKENTNVTIVSASPNRADNRLPSWSSSTLAGTQSALQASLASSTVWVLGPNGQPLSIPTTLYMGQVLAAGAAGLPMPQLVPPPPVMLPAQIPEQPVEPEPVKAPAPESDSKVEKEPEPEPVLIASDSEAKIDDTKGKTTSVVGKANLLNLQDNKDGKINLSLQFDVASLPSSAQAVLSAHPSFRLVLVTDSNGTVTEEKATTVESTVAPEPSFITPNLMVEDASQRDISIVPPIASRTISPERRSRSVALAPPPPLPVDVEDQARAQALAHSVLIAKIRSTNSGDNAPSRRPSGVGGSNSMGFNSSGFVPSSPRTTTGLPPAPVTPRSLSYVQAAAAAIVQSSATSPAAAEAASSIFNIRTVASEAMADTDVTTLFQGLPPELKHAYPTRLLLSLVSDLCEEINSCNDHPLSGINTTNSLSTGTTNASDFGKKFYTADLASAWLWFLQLARDIRCSWASGTRWAANRRKDRMQVEGPWPIAVTLKQEAMTIINASGIKQNASTSVPSSPMRAEASVSFSQPPVDTSDSMNNNDITFAREILATGLAPEGSTIDTKTVTGLDFDENNVSGIETLSIPTVDETDVMADEAVAAASTVYEPLGDVVQEDHVLRLLKRVPFPSIASKTLFVRAALAFAGWGCLNIATATVMKTHLEEIKANAMNNTDSVSRPQSRGITVSSSLNYDKSNVSDDLVAEEMAIVEAVLLEPVTLVSSSMVGTYTEAGVRIGPGILLTPSEAKASVTNIPLNASVSLNGGPSLPSPLSAYRGIPSLRYSESTFSGMAMNSNLRGSITGIGGNFSSAPNTIVDGMNIVPVFDAPAWRILHYVRGRACSPHSLTAILATPTDSLALHYAFVRQCLAKPPTVEEVVNLANAAIARSMYGISPSGATVKEDPAAAAEDMRIFSGCPLPPGRQYYPTRYLLALVRSVIAACNAEHPSATIPENELPDVNSPIVKAAWFLFLQLRSDMNATWATAVRWLEAASPGVVSNSLPSKEDGTEASYPPGSLNAYIPFGEVAQMDHVLRLLSKLSLPSTEAKALFVRTALAFAGWGALEDASATIMRSHLDELAIDHLEATVTEPEEKPLEIMEQSIPEKVPEPEVVTADDTPVTTNEDIFRATFSFNPITDFSAYSLDTHEVTKENQRTVYYLAIVDSATNNRLYHTPAIVNTYNDKVIWPHSFLYIPSIFSNDANKNITLQIWCANNYTHTNRLIGSSKTLTLQQILENSINDQPVTIYSTPVKSNKHSNHDEGKKEDESSIPTSPDHATDDEPEAQGFININLGARFTSAPSLVNVLSHGLQLTATFAIDFTSGNGVPFTSEGSLHSSVDHLNNQNADTSFSANLLHSPYATALAILASLVRKLNSKTDIHAIGFGAIPALEDMSPSTAAMSVIPIRPSTMDIASSPLASPSSLAAASKISDVSGLMDAYVTAVTSVQPGDRRLYQPTLDSYFSIVQDNHATSPKALMHNILFILTSGEPEDELSVAKQIANAALSTPSTIVIVCVVPSGTDQFTVAGKVDKAARIVEDAIQLRRSTSTVPILYNDIICVPYSPGDTTEDRTIAGAILSSSVLTMLSESIIEHLVITASPEFKKLIEQSFDGHRDLPSLGHAVSVLGDNTTFEFNEKVRKENDEHKGNNNPPSIIRFKSTVPKEAPLSVDAAMVKAEGALTAPIRLVPAEQARIFGKGGVGLQKGVTLGITDVQREIHMYNRFPLTISVFSDNTNSNTKEKQPLVFSPLSWNILSHVRERVSSDNNLAMLASTPPEALLVHYNFLRGCLTAPASFDKAGFEAQEAEMWSNTSSRNNRKRDQDSDSDLANLLMDRTGIGMLLTNSLRNEISTLLGVSPLRAAISNDMVAPIDIDMAHASDLDGTPLKVVFLVAKTDGRSPMLDPVTRQPIMVRSMVPLEHIEMVMAQLGKSSRRQLGPIGSQNLLTPSTI